MDHTHIKSNDIDQILDGIDTAGSQSLPTQLVAAERALELSKIIGYYSGESKANYLIASLYTIQHDYPKVAAYAQQAVAVAQKHGLEVEKAHALVILAGAYANSGMTLEGLELLQQHDIAAIAQQHSGLQERYLNTLAISYLNTENFANAIQNFQRVLELGQANQRGNTEFVALYNLGSVYSLQNDIANSLHYFSQASKTAERYLWTGKQIAALLAIVGALLEENRLSDAEQTLAQIEQLSQASSTALGSGFLRFRGLLLHHQGASNQGIRDLESSLDLAKSQNDWNTTRFLLNELSEIYEQCGEYQKALQYVRALYTQTQQVNHEQIQARVQTLQALHEVENLRLRSDAAERELIAYKQAEQERLEKERMGVILQQEQEFARQKQRVLTRLNHEMRTPITIISTSAHIFSMYAHRLSPEAALRHSESIQIGISRFERHLNNISAVLQANNDEVLKEPVELSVLELCQVSIEQAENTTGRLQRVLLDLADAPASILLDRDLAVAILTELLANALKFSEETVDFHVQLAAGQLSVSIKDRGIGIPAAEQQHIFEPLYRASNTDDVDGNGLGLTIVRDYVRHLGGTIHFTSEVGHGTAVNVRLPLPKRGSTGPLGKTPSN